MGRLAVRFAPVVASVALACTFDTTGMATDGPAESVGASESDATSIDSSVSASTTVSGTGTGTGTSAGVTTASTTMTTTSTSSETGTPDTEGTEDSSTTAIDASAYRQRISMSDLGGTKAANTQVLVELSPETIRWDVVASDLSNVDFYTTFSGQRAKLSFEIDWLTDEYAEVWVLLPEASAEFDFFVEYGEGVQGGEAPNSAEVWGEYEGVWHLNEDPNAGVGVVDQFKDSSGNDNHLTNAEKDKIPDEDMVIGIAGRAPRFTSGRELQSNHWGGSDITGPVTMEGWVLLEDQPDNGYRHLISKNNCYRLTILRDSGDSPGTWERPLGVVITDQTDWRGAVSDESEGPGAWHYYAFVFEPDVPEGTGTSRSRVYLDGLLVGEEDWPAFTPNSSTSFFRVGTDLPGLVDEVRFAHHARSDAWVEIQYLSMSRDLLEFGDPMPIP